MIPKMKTDNTQLIEEVESITGWPAPAQGASH
jgi:hypothetical protein